MAKMISYKFLSAAINHGTEEEPQIEEILTPVTMGWNEANEELAKREAYNGEYTVEDDGQPDPAPIDDDDEYDDMAAAIREGVNGI